MSRALLGAALFLCLAAGAAQEPVELTIRATGYAQGVGYTSRDRAVLDAKQKALVEFLRAMVASEDLKLFRPVLRSTEQYIPRHDLLRTDEVDGDTRVEIDAYLMEAPLHRDIAAIMLPRLPEKPRVLLLIGEQMEEDPMLAVPDFGTAELALKKYLDDKGLETRGADTLEDTVPYPRLIEVVNGGIEEGSAFALGCPDHVVVVGSAVSASAGGDDTAAMKTNAARLTLNIYRGADGKLMDDVVCDAIVHSTDPHTGGIAAIQDACGKAQGSVITAAVLAVLSTRASDQVLVTVLHPQTQEHLNAVIQAIETHPSAGRVEQLFFSPTLARLALPYEGPMGDLSDYLSTITIAGRPLEVTRVLQREMELTLK
ncbi:MAG: hypothetical protein GC168_03305 [Candidatus Hydrogenedens sp.]|nr:hypothetical protein [Candidatus Hydrogenedens sp.]